MGGVCVVRVWSRFPKFTRTQSIYYMLKAKTLKASSPQKNSHFCLLYFDHTETATFPDQLAQPAKNMPFDHIHTGSLPMKRRYSVTHTVSHFTNEEKIQCEHTQSAILPMKRKYNVITQSANLSAMGTSLWSITWYSQPVCWLRTSTLITCKQQDNLCMTNV